MADAATEKHRGGDSGDEEKSGAAAAATQQQKEVIGKYDPDLCSFDHSFAA